MEVTVRSPGQKTKVSLQSPSKGDDSQVPPTFWVVNQSLADHQVFNKECEISTANARQAPDVFSTGLAELSPPRELAKCSLTHLPA